MCRSHVKDTVAGDLTHNRKQIVNSLKIPQGLSTLLFRQWSEVPSRGGVHGESPEEQKTCFTKTPLIDLKKEKKKKKKKKIDSVLLFRVFTYVFFHPFTSS